MKNPKIITLPLTTLAGQIKAKMLNGENFSLTQVEYEQEYLQFGLNLLKQTDIVYDIGAAYGIFGLPAALITKHVFLFEPNSLLQQRIFDTIKMNELNNCTVINVAISDKTGFAMFYNRYDKNNPISSLLTNNTRTGTQVPTTSLDDFITTHSPPSVIKIDIEGGEILALPGASRLIRSKQVRMWMIEFHLGILKHKNIILEHLLTYFDDYQIIYRNKRQHISEHPCEHIIFNLDG